MGLFSVFHRREEDRDLLFRVEDAFGLHSGGAVVTGQVVRGEVRKGDALICRSGREDPFPCTARELEQPDPRTRRPTHPGAVRWDGPWQGRCALLIPEYGPERFRPGDQFLLGDE